MALIPVLIWWFIAIGRRWKVVVGVTIVVVMIFICILVPEIPNRVISVGFGRPVDLLRSMVTSKDCMAFWKKSRIANKPKKRFARVKSDSEWLLTTLISGCVW